MVKGAKKTDPVLLVDDYAFNLMVIDNFVKAAGFQTVQALNGQLAVDKVRE